MGYAMLLESGLRTVVIVSLFFSDDVDSGPKTAEPLCSEIWACSYLN